jgi:hypothetical protein
MNHDPNQHYQCGGVGGVRAAGALLGRRIKRVLILCLQLAIEHCAFSNTFLHTYSGLIV